MAILGHELICKKRHTKPAIGRLMVKKLAITGSASQASKATWGACRLGLQICVDAFYHRPIATQRY